MNVNQCVAAIVASYETKQPLMLWGPPGVGKSSAGRQAQQILKKIYPPRQAAGKGKDEFGFIDLRLSLMDPVDLRGIPQINQQNSTVFLVYHPGYLIHRQTVFCGR